MPDKAAIDWLYQYNSLPMQIIVEAGAPIKEAFPPLQAPKSPAHGLGCA
jgi:hypothetical protein